MRSLQQINVKSNIFVQSYMYLYVSKAMLPATLTGKDANAVNYDRAREHFPGAAPSAGDKLCHLHYS